MHIAFNELTGTDFSDVATGATITPGTPGDLLRSEFMEPMGLSANALARRLHVPANRITAIVNGRRAITADTALRLGRCFGMSAEFWVNLQSEYALRLARRESVQQIEAEVEPLEAA